MIRLSMTIMCSIWVLPQRGTGPDQKLALQVNAALLEIFASIQIQLIDFKIEIGKTKKGELLLADEISPDTAAYGIWVQMNILIKMSIVVI